MVKFMQEMYIHDTIEDVIYYITAVDNINVNSQNIITSYPTSEGANISDHAYNEPKTLTLIFSISKYNNSNGFYYKNVDNSRIRLSYEETKELIRSWDVNHVLLNLQTLNFKYNNLLISGYNFPEASDIGAITYNISLQEIRIATVKTIVVPIEKSSSTEDQVNDNGEVDTGMSAANIIGATAAGTAVGVLSALAIGAAVGASAGPVGIVIGAAIGGFFGWLLGVT